MVGLLLALLLVATLLVACRKKIRRKCRCCQTSHKIEGPIISVSYRSSYQGDRESYYIKTDEPLPTTFYTRPGEDDASKEFTTIFIPSRREPTVSAASPATTRGQQREVRNVKFKSLERDWRPSSSRKKVFYICTHLFVLAQLLCSNSITNPALLYILLSNTQRKEREEERAEEREQIENVRKTLVCTAPLSSILFSALHVEYSWNCIILQEYCLSDLDNLERMLDSALVKFETTTL